MTHDVTAKELPERLRFHADAFGAISLTGHLFRQAADELDRLAGEVERARIEGMEEALRNVWQCYTGNHPAYGVGPDWDKALDGCCKLIEADIAKLKAGGRTGAG